MKKQFLAQIMIFVSFFTLNNLFSQVSQKDINLLFDAAKNNSRLNAQAAFREKSGQQTEELLFATNTEGDTALHIAASKGNSEIVQFLLQRAEILSAEEKLKLLNKKNNTGLNPIEVARQNNYKEIANSLESNKTKIFQEIKKGWLLLIEAGKIQEIINILTASSNDQKKELLNIVDQEGKTALMIAARNNHKDIVEALLNDIKINKYLELKEYINRKDAAQGKQVSALWRAARFADQETMEILLKNDANPNTTNHTDTPLISHLVRYAKDLNDINKIKLLLEVGANTNIQDPIGDTPLIHALNNPNEAIKSQVISLLLRKGANPLIQNNQGESAYNLANEFYKNIFENYIPQKINQFPLILSNAKALFIEYNKLNLENEQNKKEFIEKIDAFIENTLPQIENFPVLRTIHYIYLGALERKVENPADESILKNETDKVYQQIVLPYIQDPNKLLKKEIFTNTTINNLGLLDQIQFAGYFSKKIRNEFTEALLNAIEKLSEGISRKLLINKILDLKRKWGINAPLSQEVQQKLDKILKKAPVDEKKELLNAAAIGNLDKVKQLLQNKPLNAKKALVEATDNFDRTPLMLAARNGHNNIVKFILQDLQDSGYPNLQEYISKPSKAPELGLPRQVSALWRAAYYNQFEAFKTLLDYGGNPNEKNPATGDTPLIVVVNSLVIPDNQIAQLVKTLLDKGADPSIQNNEGKTALDYAQERGLTDTVKILEPAPAPAPTPVNYQALHNSITNLSNQLRTLYNKLRV